MSCVISRAILLSGIFTPKMSVFVTMSSSFNHVCMPNVFYPLPAAAAQQPPAEFQRSRVIAVVRRFDAPMHSLKLDSGPAVSLPRGKIVLSVGE
jgi:hypothetical protein